MCFKKMFWWTGIPAVGLKYVFDNDFFDVLLFHFYMPYKAVKAEVNFKNKPTFFFYFFNDLSKTSKTYKQVAEVFFTTSP